MVISYIVKLFDDICISYTLLYGDIADGLRDLASIIEQSPIVVPFSVRNTLSRILDRFV